MFHCYKIPLFFCLFFEQKLEEMSEELLRASEAERSLRNRCAALQSQIHRNEQAEVTLPVIRLIKNIKGFYIFPAHSIKKITWKSAPNVNQRRVAY